MKRLLIAIAFLLAFSSGSFAQSKLAMPFVKQQFFDNSGRPCASCRLYTYEAGTTTPLATFRDANGISANTNPIIMDSTGRANIFVGSDPYDFALKSPANAAIWTVLNVVSSLGGSGTGCDISGTSDTQVIYNDMGACAGDSGLTYIAGSDALTVAGSVSTPSAKITGSTLGTVTITAPNSFTSYALVLPSDDGSASQFLQTNGSGVLTWATAGGGSGCDISGTSTTQVIFNLTGACAGDTHFLWAESTDTLTIGVASGGPYVIADDNQLHTLSSRTTANESLYGVDHIIDGSGAAGVDVRGLRVYAENVGTNAASSVLGAYIIAEDAFSTSGTQSIMGLKVEASADDAGTDRIDQQYAIWARNLNAGKECAASCDLLAVKIESHISQSTQKPAIIAGVSIDSNVISVGSGVGEYRGVYVGDPSFSNGTIDASYGVRVESQTVSSGAITLSVGAGIENQSFAAVGTSYALKIVNQDQSCGSCAGSAFGIFTGRGPSVFGDTLTIDFANAGTHYIQFIGPSAGAPTSPAAASYIFYIDTSDSNKLKVVGGSGTVTPIAIP